MYHVAGFTTAFINGVDKCLNKPSLPVILRLVQLNLNTMEETTKALSLQEEQIEIWVDIPEYIGIYQISNLGRVKGVERYYQLRGKIPVLLKEKILYLNTHKDGYVHVNLCKNGKVCHPRLSRIMLKSFIGPSDLQVDHIDGDKQNNKLSNLQYLTGRENTFKYFSNIPDKLIGAHYNKRSKKYHSVIKINGKSIQLGAFNNKEDAHAAYLEAHKKASFPTIT